MPRLSPGEPFPSLKLQSVDGPVELAERWSSGPLVVAFMRHFGCPHCHDQLAQLGAGLGEVESAGGAIVSVFKYSAQPTANFCRRREVAFDCLADPAGDAYAAVGLVRGAPRDYLAAGGLARGIGTTARELLAGAPRGDIAQLPGTFVVDSRGRTLYAHYNRNSSDNPRPDTVLDAVRGAASPAPA